MHRRSHVTRWSRLLLVTLALASVAGDASSDDPDRDRARSRGRQAMLLRDINQLPATRLVTSPQMIAGRNLYYTRTRHTTGTELWVGNGVTDRLRLVADIVPGRGGSSPLPVATLGDRLVFIASSLESGLELWIADGTPAGTYPLTQTDVTDRYDFRNFFVFGERLFFQAHTDAHGLELYVTDGTTDGTRRLTDIGPGTRSAQIRYQGPYGDGFLFLAQVGVAPRAQLYSFDPNGDVISLLSADWPFSLRPYDSIYDAERERFIVAAESATSGWTLWTTGLDPTTARQLRGLDPNLTLGSPASFFPALGRVFFQASDPNIGWELWMTDGTDEGTRLVRDIDPRPGYSSARDPEFSEVGGAVVFPADDAFHGTELWRTDGTFDGTWLLIDAYPGPEQSRPVLVRVANGVAYYAVVTPEGHDLLRTDGTAAGTYFVGEPGLPLAERRTVRKPIGPDDFLYYSSRSDGTDAGTGRIVVPPPANEDGGGGAWHVFGDRMLFYANDGSIGTEPWVTNGTREGTSVFMDLDPSGGSYQPGEAGESYFTRVGEWSYFAVDIDGYSGRLYRTDGTTARTTPVFDGITGRRVVLDGRLIFSDRTIFSNRLWIIDDDESAPTPLTDPDVFSRISPVAALRNGKGVFVSATQKGGPTRLWFSNGRDPGITLLSGSTPGSQFELSSARIAELGRDRIVFVGREGFSNTEPWISDGSLEGTRRLFDVIAGSAGSGPDHLHGDGDRVFFSAQTMGFASEPLGRELWTTDGTPEGTRLVRDIRPGNGAAIDGRAPFVSANGVVLFVANDGEHGAELWRTDGSAEGTFLLRDIRPGSLGSDIESFDRIGRHVLFGAHDGVHGREIWVTDGTTRGTTLLIDQVRGSGSSDPFSFYPFRGRIFFSAIHDQLGREIWSFPEVWLAGERRASH